ncbi:Hypothetical predicted protein [Octopus vulgaris]|uniref:Uncharacterized protein n=1 Tax=Octopus vulgaris TaxID=6645 RepID=A0AA36BMB8_OCTVU|nr:Hypothetical predicted protein [Octopus vulgaris]
MLYGEMSLSWWEIGTPRFFLLKNLFLIKMKEKLFSELESRYPEDVRNVSSEVADGKLIVSPAAPPRESQAATPSKEKNGEGGKFVQSFLQLKLANNKLPKRIDVNRLNTPSVHNGFVSEINNLSCDGSGNSFKETVDGVCSNILGFVETKHLDWFDDNDEEIGLML